MKFPPLPPVIATVAQEELTKTAAARPCPATPTSGVVGQEAKHHPVLVKLICDQLGVTAEQICDFELSLADASPAGK